jgi:hypothetical protein
VTTLSDILHEIVNEPHNEDLRKWFGKGKTGSSTGGGGIDMVAMVRN